MKIADLRELLRDKRVNEEINKHLWIESQKAGYSIGIERATDEWMRLYAADWVKYHMPEKYGKSIKKKSNGKAKPRVGARVKKAGKKSANGKFVKQASGKKK